MIKAHQLFLCIFMHSQCTFWIEQNKPNGYSSTNGVIAIHYLLLVHLVVAGKLTKYQSPLTRCAWNESIFGCFVQRSQSQYIHHEPLLSYNMHKSKYYGQYDLFQGCSIIILNCKVDALISLNNTSRKHCVEFYLSEDERIS